MTRLVIQPYQRVGAAAARRRQRIPGASAVEDDDVTWLDRAEMVDELVYEHFVADVERLLHRRRGYEEGLDDKALNEQGDDQRDNDQYRQFAPERPVFRPSRRRSFRILVRLRAAARLGVGVAAWRTRCGSASQGLAAPDPGQRVEQQHRPACRLGPSPSRPSHGCSDRPSSDSSLTRPASANEAGAAGRGKSGCAATGDIAIYRTEHPQPSRSFAVASELATATLI